MRAARWHGRHDVRVEDLPMPDPGEDEALVRVQWTGLCGSDLEEYLSGPTVVRGPVVLGHEVVGEVAVPARDGSGPPRGTVVVLDVITGCGHCYWCLRHEEGLCPQLVVTGQHRDGGLAEYVTGRASRLVPVPRGLSPQHAALAEPAAVAVRCVRRVGPLLGRGALVVGGGTIGLLVGQALVGSGASRVVVVEPGEWRRTVAAAVGLDAVWAPDEDQRRAVVGDLFPGRGVDVVVECSGARGAVREAVRLVRRGGTVVLLGVTPADEPFDATDAVLGEKTVHGSAAHMWDDDVAVAVQQLASGALRVAPLISATMGLEDAPQAFAALAEGPDRILKLLVDCREQHPVDA